MHRNFNNFILKPGENVIFNAWPKKFDFQRGYGFMKRIDSTTNSPTWGTADGSQKKFIMCQKSECLSVNLTIAFY